MDMGLWRINYYVGVRQETIASFIVGQPRMRAPHATAPHPLACSMARTFLVSCFTRLQALHHLSGEGLLDEATGEEIGNLLGVGRIMSVSLPAGPSGLAR